MNNFLDDSLPTNPSLKDDGQKLEARKQNLEEHQIKLLEEKLVVKRLKQKVGEVIVRKEIETRIVHLPIRREKLIIEKAGGAGGTNERLTEIDLQEGEINGVKFSELSSSDNLYLTQSSFVTLEKARQMLTELQNRSNNENVKLRIEIIADSFESQTTYQNICGRYH